ncbi:Cleavage and polyadenylation specificity factor [Musa troglodytarum]|uniref:Pre-mRNA cleavage factor Im 25 kDa subunit n=1 Tax=Musa troglodytarum TaxID=320322 RepID=A0A9E7JCM2_9LILI|nr:Cleavage and polyadenylation specificity factor [Musa troglodytarum]URD75633.1 Cleavage and polyadenylation specificity factor [Musa troglodytarum]
MEDGETFHRNDSGDGGGGSNVVEIYPLSRYFFGSKDAIPDKDDCLADRIQRMKANYAARGMRTCVHGILLVELFQHPHVLLLQVRNSFFKLPGGRLRPGESDVEGLKRKLSRKLSSEENGTTDDWQIDERIGMWWRSDFETLPFPYLPPNLRRPKECTKLFLVKLPMTRHFIVPRNLKLLAVPLCQLHDNSETYGPIISGIPQLLSKFSFNIIQD